MLSATPIKTTHVILSNGIATLLSFNSEQCTIICHCTATPSQIYDLAAAVVALRNEYKTEAIRLVKDKLQISLTDAKIFVENV